MARLTWTEPNGSWGIKGGELGTLPPNAYGALYKLKQMEDLIDRIHDPDVSDWEASDAVHELLATGRPALEEVPARRVGPGVFDWIRDRFLRIR